MIFGCIAVWLSSCFSWFLRHHTSSFTRTCPPFGGLSGRSLSNPSFKCLGFWVCVACILSSHHRPLYLPFMFNCKDSPNPGTCSFIIKQCSASVLSAALPLRSDLSKVTDMTHACTVCRWVKGRNAETQMHFYRWNAGKSTRVVARVMKNGKQSVLGHMCPWQTKALTTYIVFW